MPSLSEQAVRGRPVERVSELSRERFRTDFLFQSRPVVVTGGVRDWPAMQRWTVEWLKERLAGHRVEIASAASGVFSYDLEAPRAKYQVMEFSKAASLVAEGKQDVQYYIMQISIEDWLPELSEDLQSLPVLSGEAAAPHFWLGGAGLLTPLHWDNLHNFFAQVSGRKRFTLFPPGEFDKLYPYPAAALFSHMSHADPEDLDRWPQVRDAERLDCVLEAGDLLFLPSFWWHQVRSLELSISVNFWWAPFLPQCYVPAFLRTLRTAYTRDRLAGLGSPVSTFPGGPIAAARAALRSGQSSFAVLFAAAALEAAVRQRCHEVHIEDSDENGPRPVEVLHAELAASGGDPTGLDAGRMTSWIKVIRSVVAGEPDTPERSEAAATAVQEIGAFLGSLR